MATCVFIGGAPAVAKVITCTIGGTIETTDIFRATIGNKTLSVVGGSPEAAACATAFAAAWNALSASDYPEFAEITALATGGGALTLTAKTPGMDFAVTLSTTETGGGTADNQTFTQSTTIVNDGPNHLITPANWSGAALPVDDDTIIIEKGSGSIYYGLDQLEITPDLFIDEHDATETIGLPRVNETGLYPEYREQYLKISPDVCVVNGGTGRLKLNTGTVQTAITILNTGTPAEDGLGAVIWKGTHASNAVSVTKGDLSIAPFAGEVATVLTLKMGYYSSPDTDAIVRCGSGVTLGTIIKNGGNLTCDTTTAAIASFTNSAGEATIYGMTNAVTSLSVYGGRVYYSTAGTLTAAVIMAEGVLDFSRDMRSKTVTAIQTYGQNTIFDPASVVTFSGGIDYMGCEGINGLGKHRTWTPSAI
ncbi:hypothetical protein M0R72_10250 [Candidatus Pacearchaeota archaeon]|jgi:hypothetical protein|nr:hypothetical protein [Candidatus Pacearchaeota archaeon]